MHAAVVRSFDEPPRYERVRHAGACRARRSRWWTFWPWACIPEFVRARRARHYSSSGDVADDSGRRRRRAPARWPPGVLRRSRRPSGAPWRRRPSSTSAPSDGATRGRGQPQGRRGNEPGHVLLGRPPRRVPLQAGQSVLVLGATGNAGGMAVQVAKRLGAGHVVAAGRNPDGSRNYSETSGADAVVALDDTMPALTAERLARRPPRWTSWSTTSGVNRRRDAVMALLGARRSDRSRALDWVQIGADGRTHHGVAVRRAPLGQPHACRATGRVPSRRRTTWPSSLR